MKYAVEMGSGVMIYIPSFIKTGFRHTKADWGGGLKSKVFANVSLSGMPCGQSQTT
jgi:hypothetical protein